MASGASRNRILAALIVAVAAAGLYVEPLGAQTGVIQGRVDFEAPTRSRRSANRYPGGRAETHTIQTLPAVAYLVGPVPGSHSESAAVMTQQDTTFIPSVVFVPPGGSVSFPNGDRFQHNVYSYSGGETIDLGRQNPGSAESVNFAEAGIFEVFCEVHSFMRGAIIVTESPHSAIVGADGSFRITGVPSGEYTIAFWHPEYDPEARIVTVTAGGTATVQVQMRR